MEETIKFDVSVILPIKSSKVRDFNDYFTKSIESLKIQKTSINELIIVHTHHRLIMVLEVRNHLGCHYLSLMTNTRQFGLKMF